jgi:shikimate dehydrogenase
VAHSRSPIVHQFWLRELEIQGSYRRFAVPPEGVSLFAGEIGRDGLVGSNVTVPHKEAAFAACDRRTSVADALEAVNTLWREDGLLWGDNTDVDGFLANMDEGAPDWSEMAQAAVIIGAGGAARAIVNALASRGLRRIAIVNRTHARAVALATRFGPTAVALPWSKLDSEVRHADLVVNASSLGMNGQPSLELDLVSLPPHAVVADIVYAPLRTRLVEAARARRLRTVEGLGMLLHQAAPSFERLFGARPKVTPRLRALVEAHILGEHSEIR